LAGLNKSVELVVDGAYQRGELDDEGWFAYLAAENPRARSGHRAPHPDPRAVRRVCWIDVDDA
jgi:hypothetical protein